MLLKVIFSLGWLGLILSQPCFAISSHGKSQTPFIDSIRKQMRETDAASSPQESLEPSVPDPYIQSILEKMGTQDEAENQSSYIDQVIQSNPGYFQKKEENQSYLKEKKKELGPQKEGGAIQAVLEGKSELKPRFEGPIHHTFGFRYGVALNYNLSASSSIQERNFQDVYGSNYAPSLSFFYEYQPLRSEKFGNIGLMASAGVNYFHGYGKFAKSLVRADGQTLPSNSQTVFQFFTIPASLALNVKFNVLKYVRPYVNIGPTTIYYLEKRKDTSNTAKGVSFSLLTSVGVAFLMDWISPQNTWDIYATHSIQHIYLTLDYSRYIPVKGDVNYNVSGFTGGIAFEY